MITTIFQTNTRLKCTQKFFQGGNPVALPQVAGPPQTSAQRVVPQTTTTTTTRRPPPTQSPSRTVTQPPARRPISQLQPDDDELSAEELVKIIIFLQVAVQL